MMTQNREIDTEANKNLFEASTGAPGGWMGVWMDGWVGAALVRCLIMIVIFFETSIH